MKPGYNLLKNAGYALKGLRALLGEGSFKTELLFAPVSLIIVFVCASSFQEGVFVFASYLLVLGTEAMNSAVEATVDLVSPEYHPLAGKAKDMASAAVFISVVTALLLHISIIL